MKTFIWNELKNKLSHAPIIINIDGYSKEFYTLKEGLKNNSKIKYKIGNSPYYLSYNCVYSAFEKSIQQVIQTNDKCISADDLKKFEPQCFDEYNGGKICHRAAFFAILIILGIANRVSGGIKKDPYNMIIFPCTPPQRYIGELITAFGSEIIPYLNEPI